jgi:hypothetical protein
MSASGNRNGGATDLITLKRQAPVVFSRQLNATLVPSYVFKESGVPGQKPINDAIHVLTKVTTARDWNAHLDLHRSIRELLVVAGWEHCGIQNIEVAATATRSARSPATSSRHDGRPSPPMLSTAPTAPSIRTASCSRTTTSTRPAYGVGRDFATPTDAASPV